MSIENRNLKPGTVLVAVYPARGPKRKEYRCEVVAEEEGHLVARLIWRACHFARETCDWVYVCGPASDTGDLDSVLRRQEI